MPKIKVKFLGVFADELGTEELIVEANNLNEVFVKLKKIPRSNKLINFSTLMPKDFVSIYLNGKLLTTEDLKNSKKIALSDGDTIVFSPIASGGT